jgi:hypothetical protein
VRPGSSRTRIAENESGLLNVDKDKMLMPALPACLIKSILIFHNDLALSRPAAIEQVNLRKQETVQMPAAKIAGDVKERVTPKPQDQSKKIRKSAPLKRNRDLLPPKFYKREEALPHVDTRYSKNSSEMNNETKQRSSIASTQHTQSQFTIPIEKVKHRKLSTRPPTGTKRKQSRKRNHHSNKSFSLLQFESKEEKEDKRTQKQIDSIVDNLIKSQNKSLWGDINKSLQ